MAGQRKTRQGIVVSDKMDKTVIVRVERLVQHPMYRKYVRQRKKYKVHDPENRCHLGDRVSIVETRPLSKEKNWRVQTVLRPANVD
ncbi:MAG: 30S ribosomal protein S17 [Desulfurellaceae bacterium]|nr:30S ribosomal protein S17 [Desulfurellaceae bacterium]